MAYRRSNFYKNPKIYTVTSKNDQEIKISPKFIKIGIILIIVILLGWFLFFSNYFKIKTIEISGTLNPEVKNSIDGFYGKNILTFRPGKIETDLAERQSSIQGLEIRRGLPNILKVQVNVRTPIIGWKTQDKIYYIDQDGIIFELTDTSSVKNIETISIVEDTKNIPIVQGTPIVTEEFVDFIKDFISRLDEEQKIKLKSIKIVETTFQIESETDQGFRIILSTTGSLDNQMKALQKVLETKRQDIKEYVDLRIEGRVYYK